MPWDANLDPDSPAFGIAAAAAQYVRVVAGPGTGKSFALKRRVARLLEEGIQPREILPVTFTNVAAEDLQRELVQIGVPGCEDIRGRTLHGLCMRILMRQNVLIATGRVPRPLNRFEMEPLLFDFPGHFGTKLTKKKRIQAYEAAWARLQQEEPGFAIDEVDQNFEVALIDWLRFHHGMLIGEIIPCVYRYLRDNPAAEEKNLYQYILVDEYQDLNKAEQAVIELLGENSHVCIVGDDDQSLYSFKHAHPAGIREWPDAHPGTDDHQMLECRRCPTLVVAMANSLIAHNHDRVERALVARPENGVGVVAIRQYDTLEDEASAIADYVLDLTENQGFEPQEILVLAQRRSIGNPIHDALIGRGVASTSYYQEGALDSVDAQERLAILKLLVNRQDRIALRWLLGLGSSDFRRGAWARVREYCEQHGLEPWDALVQLSEGELALPHTQHLVARFRAIMDEIGHLEVVDGVNDFVLAWLHHAIDEADLFHNLVLNTGPTVETHEELLDGLLDAIAQPEIPEDVTEVRIMSLHKSKGLSSPVVIIAGCVEGLLPAEPDAALPAAQREAEIEEQRRLFFVGLTRVKAMPDDRRPGTLLLTSSRSMLMADAMRSGIRPAGIAYGRARLHASRFIQELGPAAPRAQRG